MNASLGKGVEIERESQRSMIKGRDYQLRIQEGLQKDCTLVAYFALVSLHGPKRRVGECLTFKYCSTPASNGCRLRWGQRFPISGLKDAVKIRLSYMVIKCCALDELHHAKGRSRMKKHSEVGQ